MDYEETTGPSLSETSDQAEVYTVRPTGGA